MTTASGGTRLTIRDVRLEELSLCHEIQQRAFGITESGYLIPIATMVAVQHTGGLVQGAFADQMVGFSFAFLGRIRGLDVLYSQITAVDPAWQGNGIGRLLKERQREYARERCLGMVVWAFDPLRAANAHFNLAILGATARTYEVDFYGPRTDRLNAGLSTDRLLAEWSTASSPRRARTCVNEDAFFPSAATPSDDQTVRASAIRRGDTDRILVQVPADLDALKRSNMELARSWQMRVRESLSSAFAEGFVAVDFVKGSRPFYVLERLTDLRPLAPGVSEHVRNSGTD